MKKLFTSHQLHMSTPNQVANRMQQTVQLLGEAKYEIDFLNMADLEFRSRAKVALMKRGNSRSDTIYTFSIMPLQRNYFSLRRVAGVLLTFTMILLTVTRD